MSKNSNVRVIAIDKQLETMSKSLKQLSSNVYADNYPLAQGIFTMASFMHKMLVTYNQDRQEDQTIITNELLNAYHNIKDIVGAPTS